MSPAEEAGRAGEQQANQRTSQRSPGIRSDPNDLSRKFPVKEPSCSWGPTVGQFMPRAYGGSGVASGSHGAPLGV